MAFKPTFNINKVEEVNVEAQNESRDTVEMLGRLSSKQEEDLFVFKFIPRQKIRSNEKNHYPIEEIQKLETSILLNGLQQNLTVIYSMEENLYIQEAGHRRKLALDNLIQRYANWDGDPEDMHHGLYMKNVSQYETKGYPCKINGRLPEDVFYDEMKEDDKLPEEIIDSEIRLIITNEDIREKDPVIRARNVKRLGELYQLKYGEEESINDKIATALNISPRQVQKYNAVNDRLDPELKEEFDKKNINLKDAAKLSTLEPEEQKQVAQQLQQDPGKKTSDEVEAMRQRNKTLTNILQEKQDMLEEKQERIRKLEKEINKINEEPANDEDYHQQIDSLTGEISALKKELSQKPKVETVIKELSAAAQVACMEDIKLRVLLKNSNEELKKLLEAKEAYESHLRQVPEEELKMIAILSSKELNEKLGEFMEMLNLAEPGSVG